MAKNYLKNKIHFSNNLPREMVIQRILIFSNSFNANKEFKELTSLLKN
tara:strand:- start:2752 stop:2895 length:144 start_codon:yes stop_codon:yes gene_type:complete